MRKRIKQKIKEQKFLTLTGNKEIDNMIKVFSLVLLIFFLFLGITYLVVNKKQDEPDLNVDKEIQYKNIMAGRILSMPEKSYYVQVINEKDPYNGLYNQYLSKYSGKEDSLPYYTVDLSDSFNNKYISEESNLISNNVEELRFNKTAILKIKDGKIVLAYDEKEKIVEHLESLLEE